MSDGGGRRRGGPRRYRSRLLRGMLAVSLPVTALLVVLMAYEAARSLTEAHRELVADRAAGAAFDVDRFIEERRGNLRSIGQALEPLLADASRARSTLTAAQAAYGTYDVLQVVGLDGSLLVASDAEAAFDPSGQAWFERAAVEPVVSPLYVEGEEIRWVVAHPVLGEDDRAAAVVIGDLRVEALSTLTATMAAAGGAEVVVFDDQQRLVYSTRYGTATDGAVLLEQPDFLQRLDTVGARRAADGERGADEYVDHLGNRVIGGYAPVGSLDWGVVAKRDRTEALQPVRRQFLFGLGLVAVGGLLLALFASLFARREAEQLRDLTDRATAVSVDVRSNAEQLSAASKQLAATTTEQNAAVTETSATMEELARAAASIAETVDDVAGQATETRDDIEQAERDVQTSSERTLALAKRVDDIGGILALINEIADQTNLLALNAAIEAARAGDAGRGFTVVADEVRRLAERSKALAADIANIVESTRAETDATVMVMETGAKQMQRGLALLDGVAQATAHVRLTTQQQRAAVEQVAESMEQAADVSRQTSSTAQQIAASAEALAQLSARLESDAAAARERF